MIGRGVYDSSYQKFSSSIKHQFLGDVYVWYSESEDALYGHYIYESDRGDRIKGTIHTTVDKNPYPKQLEGVRRMGCASGLYEVVYPSPIHIGLTCDMVSLFDLIYHHLVPEKED